MKNTLKKSVSVLLSLMCIVSILSIAVSVNAADEQKVKVTVKNETFSTDNGAVWDGVLIDEWVTLGSDSTMQSVVEDALNSNSIEFSFNDWGYLSAINGLTEYAYNYSGGWMMTLNDWFTTQSAANYTVENDGLQNGDEINVIYSLNWGADVGSLWGDSNTKLSSLTVSNGLLDKEFEQSVTDYILYIDSDSEEVTVTPEAFNKNYQVRTYINDYKPGENGIKRNAKLNVKAGDTIYIGVGNPAWPTMNDTAEETVYSITVKYNTQNSEKDILDKFDETAAHLNTITTPAVGSIGGEWLVLGLARADIISPEFAENYYNTAVDYINDIGSNKLHRTKSTDNSRLIVALSSIGKDAADIEGYNLIEPLGDFDYVKKQGINGPIWALIALDSLGYDLPEDNEAANPTTREKLVNYLLENQTEKGGWNFTKSAPGADLTGMAITALAPYYNTNDEVKTAVDNALEAMSSLQKETGGFVDFGAVTPESSAQIIVALCSLGIDPTADSRFIKNDCSVIDNMLSFSVEGGFKHETSGDYNQMTTEQCFYALASYKRLIESKNTLYNMSDALYDLNGDYRVDINDATLLQKYIALLVDFSDTQKNNSDINGDSAVTVSDVTSLQRYLAGILR